MSISVAQQRLKRNWFLQNVEQAQITTEQVGDSSMMTIQDQTNMTQMSENFNSQHDLRRGEKQSKIITADSNIVSAKTKKAARNPSRVKAVSYSIEKE